MTTSLVTGAGGFVGAHLVRRLHARGDTVRALDVRPHDLPVEMRVADITDPASVAPLLEGVDVVFHNASLVQTARAGADRVWAVNLGGTKTMLEAARKAGVKRFVYVSSASVVYQGQDIENGTEKLPYSGSSQAPYADSKIAAEKEVLAANDAHGMLTTSLRPHVIFGPGDTRFLPAILSRAEKGQLKVGVGIAQRLSDFTYVDNLVDALVLADEGLTRDPSIGGRAYFITNGEPIPFWEFVDRVLVARGDPKIRYRVPYPIAYGAAALVEWSRAIRGQASHPEDGFTRFAVRYMCTHHYFSIDRAKKDLGYVPKVSIDEGIRRTIQPS